MNSLKKRCITVICLLGFFAVIVIGQGVSCKRHTYQTNIFHIPAVINGWKSREIPVSRRTCEILETDAVLMREYRKGNRSISLAVVYYKDSRVALHLPESCYSGQGSAVVEQGREQVGGYYANKLILNGNKGNITVLYYFKSGPLCTASYAAVRLYMLKEKILGRNRGCALVRFATDTNEGGAETLKEFSEEIQPSLYKYIL